MSPFCKIIDEFRVFVFHVLIDITTVAASLSKIALTHGIPLQGHHTVHPSMYDNDRKSIGRLRYNIRHPKFSNHCSSSCCNGSLVSQTKSRSTSCRNLMITASERADYSNAITRRIVRVGSQYQAQVDKWTESGLDSDTKWLGTRVWPLVNNEALDHAVGDDLIGKGRPDSCSCDTRLPNSVECIRLHIAENRMELKRHLGNVFFVWRFNEMGEEVSLRWTEREEKKFKDMMISDPRSFWANVARNFQGKKREELVSYYFNVFLINRRRYQNRVTPRRIDSDNDEETFGSVGGRFGRDAVSSIGSDIMICSLNRQCEDFFD